MNNVEQLNTLKEIEEDLAFSDFLNNRMSPEQRNRFEQRVKESPTLQKQLTEEKKLHDLIERAHPEFSLGDQAFTQFAEKLPSKRKGFWRQRAQWAAGFLVVIGSTALFMQANSPSTDARTGAFETLSNGEQKLITQEGHQYYSIIFRQNLSLAEKTDFANTFNLSILSGPGEGGVYTLKANSPLEQNVIENIKTNSNVRFFEPAVFVRGE